MGVIDFESTMYCLFTLMVTWSVESRVISPDLLFPQISENMLPEALHAGIYETLPSAQHSYIMIAVFQCNLVQKL